MKGPVHALKGRFDVAIIGAGVVGCAIARRFSLAGARVAVVEKAADILDGASKGNSAILHTGFDAPPGSLEHACIRAGYEEYLAIHDRLGLPVLRCGALVIAWTEEQEAALPALMEKARKNGVTDIEPFSRTRLHETEPALGPAARAAFRVPGESLIDPWAAPFAYLLQAVENGSSAIAPGQRAKLSAAAEYLAVAPTVVDVVRDVPVPDELADTVPHHPADVDALTELADRWGLRSSVNRVLAAFTQAREGSPTSA